MVNLYDDELVKIGQVSHALSQRFYHRTWSDNASLLRLIDDIEKYAAEEFAKIGFRVQVDSSPLLAGYPPTISISERIDTTFEFDYDKKKWEVEKATARGEDILNEDKNPTGKSITGE